MSSSCGVVEVSCRCCGFFCNLSVLELLGELSKQALLKMYIEVLSKAPLRSPIQ